MTDPDLTVPDEMSVSRPSHSPAAVSGDDECERLGGGIRRRLDDAWHFVRSMPFPARLSCIVLTTMIAWFLIMAPLFLAR
jgi:hypothetical protein